MKSEKLISSINIYLLFLVSILTSIVNAQVLSNRVDCTPTNAPPCNLIQNSDFNHTNPYDVNDPFTRNNIYNWTSTHGSPQITDPLNSSIVPPASATGFAYMYATAPASQFSPYTGEGIAQKVSALSSLTTYDMSFYIRFSPWTFNVPKLDEFYIVLLNCSDVNSFPSNTHNIPPIPVNSQIIYHTTNVTNLSWLQIQFSFRPNSNYNMVWIFPKQTTGSASVDFALPVISISGQVPSISPVGPIDYYTAVDAGPYQGVTLTSNISTGNQWYLNGQIIPGATNPNFTIDWNYGFGSNVAGLYYTVANGCPSNKVKYNQFAYGYGWYGEELFNFGAKYFPINTPSFYCINTTSTIRQFDLGSGTTYSWFMQNRTNHSNPPNITLNQSTFNPLSPVADIFVGNDANSFTFIKGTANNNGKLKVIDYDYLYESPYNPPRVSNILTTCANQTVNVYTLNQSSFYITWNGSNPGSSYFDWEEYEFGPNVTLLNYSSFVVSTSPLIIRVPGKNTQSSPIMVQFSAPSYIHKRFYYNSPMEGCAREDLNVVAAFGGCLKNEPNVQSKLNLPNGSLLFPNPATRFVTVNSKYRLERAEILTTAGHLIKQEAGNNKTQIVIPITEVPSGIYICKLYPTGNLSPEILKLIIKNY